MCVCVFERVFMGADNAVSVGSVSHFDPNLWEYIRKNKKKESIKGPEPITAVIVMTYKRFLVLKDFSE